MTLNTALCTSSKRTAFTKDLHIFLTKLDFLKVWWHLTKSLYRISLKVTWVVFNSAANTTHCLWSIMILQYLDLTLS